MNRKYLRIYLIWIYHKHSDCRPQNELKMYAIRLKPCKTTQKAKRAQSYRQQGHRIVGGREMDPVSRI